jgi:hypothetical protein
MFVVLFEYNVLEANWDSFEGARPTDTHLSVGVHMVLVVIVLGNTCTHRWVMRNLLSEVLVVLADQFESFTQNGVEWLVKTTVSALVLGSSEGGNIHNSFGGITFLISLVQHILILHDLSDLLDHTYWLVEVDWHTEARKIFSDSIFENLPN